MLNYDLNGIKVLITRPVELLGELSLAISKAGGIPLHLPMIKILPVKFQDPCFDNFDKIIFTSINSVLNFKNNIENNKSFIQSRDVFAIGDGTFNALLGCGLDRIIIPENKPYNSEQLLSLPLLSNINKNQILLVSGVGGRAFLKEELVKRGALVNKIEVYQRNIPKYSEVELGRIKDSDVLIATSLEGLVNLFNFAKKIKCNILVKPIILSGKRQINLAKKMGFEKIFAAHGADVNSLLEVFSD